MGKGSGFETTVAMSAEMNTMDAISMMLKSNALASWNFNVDR